MKFKDAAELMGKLVTVHVELQRGEKHYRGKERLEWSPRQIEPRAGWIVRVYHVTNGIYYSGSYDEPPEFRVTDAVPCVFVAYQPNRRPVPVPLNGYSIGGVPHVDKQRWSEHLRDAQREIMADVPRDKKGRWF